MKKLNLNIILIKGDYGLNKTDYKERFKLNSRNLFNKYKFNIHSEIADFDFVRSTIDIFIYSINNFF